MKKASDYKKIAVIGCGFIGYSWGIVFARSGREVWMQNRPSRTLETVRERMKEELDFLVEEKVLEPDDVPEIMDRIHTTSDLSEAVKDADYIQECMWEDLELKQNIFQQLTELTPAEVPIGSSCSGLRISDIVAKVKSHPERCLVAHPTNPPHLIPFMEISGDATAAEVKDSVFALMEDMGQRPVQCREVYGYVLNRLQLSLVQEALYLVQEGICTAEAVDLAVTEGLGLRWAFTGPYGVEELNSANLQEGLEKYKDYMLEFFAKEQKKVTDYDQAFTEKCVREFTPLMEGRTHEEYKRWRDRMVTRVRKLKA